MPPTTRDHFSFEELNSIFKANFQYAQSVEALEFLAELVSATTNSQELTAAITAQMEMRLERCKDPSHFFACADHASYCEMEEFEKRFLLKGLELSIGTNGDLSDLSERVERLRAIDPQNPFFRTLLEGAIEKKINGLSQHGNEIVFGLTNRDWIRETAALIQMIYLDWNDPAFYAKNMLKLSELSDIGAEERDFIGSELVTCLRQELQRDDIKLLRIIFDLVKGRSIHGEYDASFAEIVGWYESKIAGFNGSKTH